MTEATLRNEIIETARETGRLGLNLGASGNVSARCDDGFLVTPTGLGYETLTAPDIVKLSADGDLLASGGGTTRRKPSSEWRFHKDIYNAYPDAGAIVHTHSLYATALACARWSIPDFHYMVAAAGGEDIRCAPYATFGTDELSDHAVAALDGRKACLLANHGQIATGVDLPAALGLAQQVEALAGQYLYCLQAGGPELLGGDELSRVLDKFKTYGQQEPD